MEGTEIAGVRIPVLLYRVSHTFHPPPLRARSRWVQLWFYLTQARFSTHVRTPSYSRETSSRLFSCLIVCPTAGKNYRASDLSASALCQLSEYGDDTRTLLQDAWLEILFPLQDHLVAAFESHLDNLNQRLDFLTSNAQRKVAMAGTLVDHSL